VTTALPIAVVPVKFLARAKTRLASLLEPGERVALSVGLLRGVLGALAASGAVGQRLVVSPDPLVLEVAREAGAGALHQTTDGLNQALSDARATLPATATLLVLPADLPLIGPDAIAALLAAGAGEAAVVVAPDRQGTGTNALVLRPAEAVAFQFGPDSCRRHLDAARMAGLTVAVHRAPSLALDLDTPADYAELRDRGWPPFGTMLPRPELVRSTP
jgi:2-phospho-L-lactate/phosphoenolpyruvate guanylyltransferase